MIDPDNTLGKIRQAIDEGKVDDAAEQFCLLDQLLTLGGQLPMTWAQAHRPITRVGRLAVPADEPEPLGGPVPGANGHVLPEDMVAVPKDSCEAVHPLRHLQCWGEYGHEGPHSVGGADVWPNDA